MASMSTQTDCSNIDMSESNLTSEEVSDAETLQDRDAPSFISSNETSESEMQANWSELPSPLIGKIYSFLPREAQVNMSLVCRSWSEGYGSPSVWKAFTFVLNHSQLSKDPCPVMKFVQKYSSMFRHVDITSIFCSYESYFRNFCKQVTNFLTILAARTQLISVKFLHFCFLHEKAFDCKDMYIAFETFFSSQHRLERVEFDTCYFHIPNSFEFLRILLANSKNSLSYLKFRAFNKLKINHIQLNSKAVQNLPLLADLPNLKTLDTDYSLIFESMVKNQTNAIHLLKDRIPLPLSNLILVQIPDDHIKMEYLQGLTENDWKFMKKLYPNLEVELKLEIRESTQQESAFIILPNMPITHLDYSCDKRGRSDVNALFDRLLVCGTNEHLVSLKILWHEPRQHLVSTINQFIQNCDRLKFFEMSVLVFVNSIDALLESWVENRPNHLENVSIKVKFSKKDKLTGKIAEYLSILNSEGLYVNLEFD